METRNLGNFAHVIRCQLLRNRGGEAGLACREVTLAEVDPLTGFVRSEGGELVHVDLDPTTKQVKYLLQVGDIIISFRGTESTLGRVGYILEADEHTVTGQSLAVVRPYAIDSLWLYYYLARSSLREHITALASGGRLLTLHLSALRDLYVPVPSRDEVEAIRRKHAEAVKLAGQIQAAQAALRGLLEDVNGILTVR